MSRKGNPVLYAQISHFTEALLQWEDIGKN